MQIVRFIVLLDTTKKYYYCENIYAISIFPNVTSELHYSGFLVTRRVQNGAKCQIVICLGRMLIAAGFAE